jgi:glycosyltransferase involved in cell wall biosynthesis
MVSLALCITDLNVGGAERCLMELATRLDRKRFSPVVYCLAPLPAFGQTTFVPAVESAGVEVRSLGVTKATDFFAAVSRLSALLRERETQIVQTFLFHANIVGRFAAWRAGVRHTVCGIRVAERRAKWHLWLDRATHCLVEKYVCVSQSVADFSASKARLPTKKIGTIPNGVDITRFTNVEPADLSNLGLLGLGQGRRIVTFIGRFDRQKGLLQLLATARDWLRRLPDCDLLLVGEGPLTAFLRRQCQATGIAQRVCFAGWRPDIPAVLAASSLLVLTSEWEGMPNVVLEAMATELPIAATQVEGVSELLGTGFQEQSVSYGKWEDFSDLVVGILSDSSRARRLGQANRSRVEQMFTIEHMVESYQQLWERILAAPR